jgi:hypothetical protein
MFADAAARIAKPRHEQKHETAHAKCAMFGRSASFVADVHSAATRLASHTASLP